eukprot:m51a1_g2239 hypothetical protein (358) ;mRNA; f:278635-279791
MSRWNAPVGAVYPLAAERAFRNAPRARSQPYFPVGLCTSPGRETECCPPRPQSAAPAHKHSIPNKPLPSPPPGSRPSAPPAFVLPVELSGPEESPDPSRWAVQGGEAAGGAAAAGAAQPSELSFLMEDLDLIVGAMNIKRETIPLPDKAVSPGLLEAISDAEQAAGHRPVVLSPTPRRALPAPKPRALPALPRRTPSASEDSPVCARSQSAPDACSPGSSAPPSRPAPPVPSRACSQQPRAYERGRPMPPAAALKPSAAAATTANSAARRQQQRPTPPSATQAREQTRVQCGSPAPEARPSPPAPRAPSAVRPSKAGAADPRTGARHVPRRECTAGGSGGGAQGYDIDAALSSLLSD